MEAHTPFVLSELSKHLLWTPDSTWVGLRNRSERSDATLSFGYPAYPGPSCGTFEGPGALRRPRPQSLLHERQGGASRTIVYSVPVLSRVGAWAWRDCGSIGLGWALLVCQFPKASVLDSPG